MNNDDNVKEYHFARENYSETLNINELKEQFLEKFEMLKLIIKNNSSVPQKTTLLSKKLDEIAKEFIEKCECRYGKDFEKFKYEEDNNKVKELYRIINRLINELGKYNRTVDNYFRKRGIDPTINLKSYPVSINDTKTKTKIQHTQQNLSSFITLDEDEKEK